MPIISSNQRQYQWISLKKTHFATSFQLINRTKRLQWPTKLFEYLLQKISINFHKQLYNINELYVLYEILRDLISTIMKHDYRTYIAKIWNESENLFRNRKIFITSINNFKHFTKISKLFDYSLSIVSAIDYVSKLYLTRSSLASVCNRSLIKCLVTVLMEFQKVSYKTHDILINILCGKCWDISASLCI